MARNGLRERAALNVLLKTNPQSRALQELLMGAREKAHEGIRAGRADSILAKQQVQRAQQEVPETYDRATKSGERAQSMLSPLLAGLSADNPYRTINATEQAANTEELARQRARSESNLTERALAASQLPGYARQSALQTLGKEEATISGKKESLAEQQELAGRSEELNRTETERKERRQQRKEETKEKRGFKHTKEEREASEAGTSKRERERIARGESPTGKGGKSGLPKGYNTPDKHEQLQTTIEPVRTRAWHLLNEHKHKGRITDQTRQYVRRVLEQDVPASKGEEGGEKYSEKEKPGVKDKLILDVAMDLAQWGRVSKATVRELHARKYSVRQLGYTVGR